MSGSEISKSSNLVAIERTEAASETFALKHEDIANFSIGDILDVNSVWANGHFVNAFLDRRVQLVHDSYILRPSRIY